MLLDRLMRAFIAMSIMCSATGWKKYRHNFDLDERNPILKNGVTRTWMRWNFNRKLFVFSSHFRPENDVKRSHWFEHLTSFPAMEDENNTDFLLKVLCTRILVNLFSELDSLHPDWSTIMSIFSIGRTIHKSLRIECISDAPWYKLYQKIFRKYDVEFAVYRKI